VHANTGEALRFFFTIILTLLIATGARADWVVEDGTLRGFLLGDCPACAYDNWTAHITEGVARPGYNDYGPSFLDPQTNGFGHYSLVPEDSGGDLLLNAWGEVFAAAVDWNWPAVDSLLSLHEDEWFYDLVELRDQSVGRTFFLIRERLDSSFVDENVDTITTDDVVGGFRNSWGLYVFNPAAIRPNLMVQVVHPQDDFLAVPVALELFLRSDARLFMLASAGREVCWDSLHPPYDNSKSLSDPSRYGHCPFQKCHQVHFDSLDHGPSSQLVTVQMHSYDALPHAALADAHVTATCADDRPNPPLRDLVNHRDVVNLLPLYPVDGLSADSSLRQRVDRYISLLSSPRYAYYPGVGSIPITSSTDLCGYGDNQQALYSHQAHPGHPAHDVNVDPENFIHVEIDEYPDGLWTPLSPQWNRWLLGGAPATLETYALALEYYHAFVVALDSAIWYSHFSPDTIPPAAVSLYQVTRLNATEVYLRWAPQAADPAFDTYMLFFDTQPVTLSSPYRTRSTSYLTALRDFRTTASILKDLSPPAEQYFFAVGSRDVWGNVQLPCSSWQVTDGPLADVTARMFGSDTLEMNWSHQAGDSTYFIFRQTSPDSALVFFMRCDTNQVQMLLPDSLPRSLFQVQRVLKP
jgi:hypothetical protein